MGSGVVVVDATDEVHAASAKATTHTLRIDESLFSCPCLRKGKGLVLVEGTVINAMFQQHLHYLPQSRTWPESERRHNLVAVYGGTQLVQLFLFRKDRDPLLQFVNPPLDGVCSARVSGGYVATDEFIEIVEQRPGIAGIPADRRVRPAHFEGVRTQVKEHQLADFVGEVFRISQIGHDASSHAGTHHLMVVEGHTARLEFASGGFADVMKQCRDANTQLRTSLLDDGQGVFPNVLVAMERVLLRLELVELGEEVFGQARVDQPP